MANINEIAQIVTGSHPDAFGFLGAHSLDEPGKQIIRAFVIGADSLKALELDGTEIGVMEKIHDEGLFEGCFERSVWKPIKYHAKRENEEWTLIDPFSFGPVLGPVDDYLSREGSHRALYDKMGSNFIEFEGVKGTHFAVWAPNARRVSVVGDFNNWDGRLGLMRFRKDSGIWETFVPRVLPGNKYKYEIIGKDGRLQPLKGDPYGKQFELRPYNATIVSDSSSFNWTDAEYLKNAEKKNSRNAPISIYEVHLGSWKKHFDGRFYTYRELADTLLPYVSEMGFTHIELMPVSEYPFDPSWGYQPIGLFSPTARYGSPADFAHFVNKAHSMNIGVILDWVAGHFPMDSHGLINFDGTSLYEHMDFRQGYHPDWNTAIYNYGRNEVRDYLINNALFWISKYHLDGLRVDAVASMLYLDYSRKDGEWVPNKYGGRENIEAVEFLKEVNKAVYEKFPRVMSIAEESTSWPMVSQPVHDGGLGFGYKWNMGWSNDMLEYLTKDPIYRSYHHNMVTFGLLYAYSENFILPVSHDEVVHGKKSLLEKIPGDDWQKFATLRAFLAFMWAYPGKKLIFMGQEFGQRREWNHSTELDWSSLGSHFHSGVQNTVKDLNSLLIQIPALYEMDCEPGGFEWLIADDIQNTVFSWLRKNSDGSSMVVCIVNFSPVPRSEYTIPMPTAGEWHEVMNTDSGFYSGSGIGNMGKVYAYEGQTGNFPAYAVVSVPPLAGIYLELKRQ